jgi:hypothetical protein
LPRTMQQFWRPSRPPLLLGLEAIGKDSPQTSFPGKRIDEGVVGDG